MLAAAPAIAQNSTDYYGEGRKAKVTKVKLSGVNEFDNMTMEHSNGLVTFGEIPQMPKNVFAVLTNAEGEILKQKKITAEVNSFKTGNLEKGLYFLTIMYRNEGKKAFVLKQD